VVTNANRPTVISRLDPLDIGADAERYFVSWVYYHWYSGSIDDGFGEDGYEVMRADIQPSTEHFKMLRPGPSSAAARYVAQMSNAATQQLSA